MKTTLKGFRNYLNGGTLAALITPVRNQLNGGTVREFFGELENVLRSPYGAAAGFGGFIYYSETVKFWRANRKRITEHAAELADELGEDLLTMVSNFNSIKGDFTHDEIGRALYGRYNEDFTSIYNVMAWFALEEVAHVYDNYKNECEE